MITGGTTMTQETSSWCPIIFLLVFRSPPKVQGKELSTQPGYETPVLVIPLGLEIPHLKPGKKSLPIADSQKN